MRLRMRGTKAQSEPPERSSDSSSTARLKNTSNKSTGADNALRVSPLGRRRKWRVEKHTQGTQEVLVRCSCDTSECPTCSVQCISATDAKTKDRWRIKRRGHSDLCRSVLLEDSSDLLPITWDMRKDFVW
eukprot:Gregarina_sp_Pseudo_9__5724@NODE_82_length_4497_cov_12_487663_g75_i0_p6_GENE_NODE_82_length_4497_cov_12_487663_g75_i0NODE_82_length_4497_cov_12_487663_g75_i0_p6_ORF_typecomplete_len130_score23_49ARF7EP_C/PF14949_6/0_058_NODE_82_length_4497_cov_12_487663_g75_i020542443